MPPRKSAKNPTKSGATPAKATSATPRKGLPPWLIPGNPGNKGGGRPRNEVRLTSLRIFDEEGQKYLFSLLRNPRVKSANKIKALELLAKVGGVTGAVPDDEEANNESLQPLTLQGEAAEPAGVAELEAELLKRKK